MFPPSSELTPREVAIQMLSRREYSRAELARKLQQKSFQPDEIDACLDRLEEQNLQSDERFAESFKRSRRFSSPGDTPKERAKRERFLATRGFNFEQIRYALSCL